MNENKLISEPPYRNIWPILLVPIVLILSICTLVNPDFSIGWLINAQGLFFVLIPMYFWKCNQEWLGASSLMVGLGSVFIWCMVNSRN